MEWVRIIPNSNGTFHTWARIKVLAEEQEQCWVEHPGMPELGIFTWGEAGNAECGNWDFGNEELRSMLWHGWGLCIHLLTHLCFPEPESGWNLIPVVVAVSAIIIFIGFGFGV